MFLSKMASEIFKFEVLVTSIIFNSENKILLTRRTLNKKRFPGMWTVPGGHLETDYMQTDSAYEAVWYDVLEKGLKREIKEETNLEIKDIKYLRSIGMGTNLIVSYYSEVEGSWENVKLQEEECDQYAWVEPANAVNYKLIGPIYPQILEAGLIRNGK